jgi:DNA-binding HxlR family transcriptional regulator
MMPTITGSKLVFEESCMPRRVMDLFSVKWTSMVIHALDRWPGGKCRTGDLQRALPGISKKMLVQTLRDVEQRGLVYRHVHNVVPPKVEYELTPLGKTFAEPIALIFRWGEENGAALDRMDAHVKAVVEI